MNSVTKQQNFWQTLPTVQFLEHISILQDCKKLGKAALIVCNTGMGKTYNTDVFCKKNPEYTYRITVGDSYKLIDVIDELLELLEIECNFKTYAIKQKLRLITKRMQEISNDGGNPIIILDESENLKPQVLKMIKELYDAVNKYCAIVMIGTDQILDAILNRRSKNRQSVPQLWRRFKAGQRTLSPINKQRDFTPFFDKHKVDKGVRKLLMDMCDNYGELHDYLEPALREANRLGQPLTEDLYRTIYNLPKFKVA
jgi:DNA transposition AAA+ family ATPase